MVDDRKYLIWGVGWYARQAALCLGLDRVVGFAGDDGDKHNSFLNKPVLSFSGLIDQYPETDLVIAVPERASIQSRLLMYGITRYQLFESNLGEDTFSNQCVLFGTSDIATLAIKIIPGERILAICDNDQNKIGQKFGDKTITSIGEMVENGCDANILITSRSIRAISGQLTLMGLHRHQRLNISFRENIEEAERPQYVLNFDFAHYFSQCTAKEIVLYGSDYIDEAARFFGSHNIFGVCGENDNQIYRHLSLEELERVSKDKHIVVVSENPEHEEQELASRGILNTYRFSLPISKMFSIDRNLYLGNIASYYDLMMRLYTDKPGLLRGIPVKETTLSQFLSSKFLHCSPFPSLISTGCMGSAYNTLSEIAKRYSISSYLGVYTYPGAHIAHSMPCGAGTKIACKELGADGWHEKTDMPLIFSEPSEYDYSQLPFVPDLVFIDTYDEYVYLNVLVRNILFNYSDSVIVFNNMRNDAGVLRIPQIEIIYSELNSFCEGLSEHMCIFSDSKIAVFLKGEHK